MKNEQGQELITVEFGHYQEVCGNWNDEDNSCQNIYENHCVTNMDSYEELPSPDLTCSVTNCPFVECASVEICKCDNDKYPSQRWLNEGANFCGDCGCKLRQSI